MAEILLTVEEDDIIQRELLFEVFKKHFDLPDDEEAAYQVTSSHEGEIVTAAAQGSRRFNVWDKSAEQRKLDSIVAALETLLDEYWALHPVIRERVSSQFMARVSEASAPNPVVGMLRAGDDSPTVQILKDGDALAHPLSIAFYLERHLTDAIRRPIGPMWSRDYLGTNLELSRGNSDELPKSENVWRKVAIVDAALSVWSHFKEGDKPTYIPTEGGSAFGDFLGDVFGVFGVDPAMHKAHARGAMNVWRSTMNELSQV